MECYEMLFDRFELCFQTGNIPGMEAVVREAQRFTEPQEVRFFVEVARGVIQDFKERNLNAVVGEG